MNIELLGVNKIVFLPFMQEQILILDFGSQYTQLIARRLRELNVYCEIHPYNKIPKITEDIKGVILSGSPHSVREENPPKPNLDGIKGKMPLLGVCYGAQYLAHFYGGEVGKSNSREYGRAHLEVVNEKDKLLLDLSNHSQVWMSHADTILKIPNNYKVTASTHDVKVAAFTVENENTYGIQFHPEVYHSTEGLKLLRNFVFGICGCKGDWTPNSFVETSINELKNKIGNEKVILGLSGGVDSSVAAMILHKAIGKNLHCIFVDNGLLRKDEFQQVLDSYQHMGLNVKGVDAKNKFYEALEGLSDPEKKRKAIGKVFVDVFDEESKLVKDAMWLAQGTIYPDVIESISVKGPSATIKSHHNVGGLPDYMKLKVVEPLRSLFKDEVRRVGNSLGLDLNILNRHPFPGPGLAIRILGDITPEKVAILQEVDHIFIDGLKKHGLYNQVWQAGAIFLPIQSVGVMGDERTYENVVALRAVSSTDGMTADWCHLPYEFLAKVSNEIINKVKGVNRVVYDISSKPPATIEWE
jgi:GMP synthase (glutamine-hydrolysing)